MATVLIGTTIQTDNSVTLEHTMVESIAPPGNGLINPQDGPHSRSAISTQLSSKKTP